MKNDLIIPNLLNWSNRPQEIRQLSLRKEELYREILLEWGIRPLPGVIEWLTELRQHGVRWGSRLVDLGLPFVAYPTTLHFF